MRIKTCNKAQMRATPPEPMSDPFELSETAKVILRHFRDTASEPGGFEYPAILAKLVPDHRERDRAQGELESRGLVERAVYPRGAPSFISTCALTYEGKQFIENGELDD